MNGKDERQTQPEANVTTTRRARRSSALVAIALLIATSALLLPGPISAQPVPRTPPPWSAAAEQNTSLNGTRLTYYPHPDVNQCFADCAKNGNCRGATWIQPGTYNPGDSAMCYLLSSVTGKASARGHMSLIKNDGPMVSGGRPPSPPSPPTSPDDFSPSDIGTI